MSDRETMSISDVKNSSYQSIVIDESDDLVFVSPGVALFTAYDTIERRMRRFRAISLGDVIRIEHF